MLHAAHHEAMRGDLGQAGERGAGLPGVPAWLRDISVGPTGSWSPPD
jgi:hypothetical protein